MRLISALFALLLVAALAVVGIVVVLPDPAPRVETAAQPSPAERRWADRLLSGGLIQGLEHGDSRTLTLSARQLEVLAGALSARLVGQSGDGSEARTRIELGDDRAEIALSLPLPWQRGGWLNLDLDMAASEGLLQLRRLRVGGVPIPPALARQLAERGLDAAVEAELLQAVDIDPGHVRVTYGWRHDALAATGRGMLDEDERQRLLVAQQRLADTLAEMPGSGAVDLAALLSGVLAKETRNIAGDAVADNRAAILALAAYVAGEPPPIPARQEHPRLRTVRLRDRRDLAQHFIASAAIAVQGGSALSDLIGLAKELRDADGGSGFSFADLAADRAGVRFAELATGSAAGARHVQRLARAPLGDADLMPSIDGLPEGLTQTELEDRFGGPESPGYRQMSAHIEQRIDALRLHRSAPGSADAAP